MKIREWTANFEDTKTRTDARNSALADAGKHLHKRLVRCNSGYRLRRLREKKEEQLLPQQRHSPVGDQKRPLTSATECNGEIFVLALQCNAVHLADGARSGAELRPAVHFSFVPHSTKKSWAAFVVCDWPAADSRIISSLPFSRP